MRLVARGASQRWSQGSAKNMTDGFSDIERLKRLYLFLEIPSIFHVNIFRQRGSRIASDSWSDMSEQSSLKRKIHGWRKTGQNKRVLLELGKFQQIQKVLVQLRMAG